LHADGVARPTYFGASDLSDRSGHSCKRTEEVSQHGTFPPTTRPASHRHNRNTNFWSVVNGSLVALPHLMVQGGALINVGSEVSDAVIPLQGMYAASKHAVKGFTDALRVELEEIDKAPVSITLIQPTAVDTPFPQHAKNYMDREPKLPTPQIDPHQVARVILHAATTPTHHLKVGMMSKINTVMHDVVPALAQKSKQCRPTASSMMSRRAIPTAYSTNPAAPGRCTEAAVGSETCKWIAVPARHRTCMAAWVMGRQGSPALIVIPASSCTGITIARFHMLCALAMVDITTRMVDGNP
jgi:NAD(P)-dependent dehydrogenase (short-subunit alcohol dehydrogenase family)